MIATVRKFLASLNRTDRTASYFSDTAAVEALHTIRHGYGFDEDGVPIGPGGVDLRTIRHETTSWLDTLPALPNRGEEQRWDGDDN